MRVLLVSDFHGVIPKVKGYFDLILCAGDLCFSDELRDFEFSHWKEFKELGKDFHDLMTKKDYVRIFKKSINSADKILKWLSLKAKKVFIVYGNSDFDNKRIKKIKYFKAESLEKKIKNYKNIFLLKRNAKNIDGVQVLGFSGYRGFLAKFPEKKDKLKVAKANNKWFDSLNKLFLKKSKESFTIFLAHDVPRGVLDKINNKKSPINGKNIGDEYFVKFVKKYSPNLMVCGHMHDNQGKKILGKTLVINAGSAYSGNYAIAEIIKGKISYLKFY